MIEAVNILTIDAGPSPAVSQTPPAVTPDDIHIWRAWINAKDAHMETISVTLDEIELKRASRFHFEPDRVRYIAAHTMLRGILASYLAVRPCEIGFSYGRWGKPSMVVERGFQDLRFNMSRSGELLLVAVADGREIGIDIEEIRRDFAWRDVAQEFFTESDIAQIEALPKEKQLEAFFTHWTRREAIIKARGVSIGLSSLVAGQSPRIDLHTLSPAKGYCAALAVES